MQAQSTHARLMQAQSTEEKSLEETETGLAPLPHPHLHTLGLAGGGASLLGLGRVWAFIMS